VKPRLDFTSAGRTIFSLCSGGVRNHIEHSVELVDQEVRHRGRSGGCHFLLTRAT